MTLTISDIWSDRSIQMVARSGEIHLTMRRLETLNLTVSTYGGYIRLTVYAIEDTLVDLQTGASWKFPKGQSTFSTWEVKNYLEWLEHYTSSHEKKSRHRRGHRHRMRIPA